MEIQRRHSTSPCKCDPTRRAGNFTISWYTYEVKHCIPPSALFSLSKCGSDMGVVLVFKWRKNPTWNPLENTTVKEHYGQYTQADCGNYLTNVMTDMREATNLKIVFMTERKLLFFSFWKSFIHETINLLENYSYLLEIKRNFGSFRESYQIESHHVVHALQSQK